MFFIDVKDNNGEKYAAVGLPTHILGVIGDDLKRRIITKLARSEEFKDLDVLQMDAIHSVIEASVKDLMTDDLNGWNGFERATLIHTTK